MSNKHDQNLCGFFFTAQSHLTITQHILTVFGIHFFYSFENVSPKKVLTIFFSHFNVKKEKSQLKHGHVKQSQILSFSRIVLQET